MKVFDWLISIQHFECYCYQIFPSTTSDFTTMNWNVKNKRNNRLTPRVQNIIRCCTSKRKSRFRCCTQPFVERDASDVHLKTSLPKPPVIPILPLSNLPHLYHRALIKPSLLLTGRFKLTDLLCYRPQIKRRDFEMTHSGLDPTAKTKPIDWQIISHQLSVSLRSFHISRSIVEISIINANTQSLGFSLSTFLKEINQTNPAARLRI